MRYVALGLAAAALSFSANTTNSAPTFYKDVLPVLQNNCQECHRPGEAAPMSFLTYESTRPWAKAIKAAVVTKKMPPWFADPNHGRFANDRDSCRARKADPDLMGGRRCSGRRSEGRSQARPIHGRLGDSEARRRVRHGPRFRHPRLGHYRLSVHRHPDAFHGRSVDSVCRSASAGPRARASHHRVHSRAWESVAEGSQSRACRSFLPNRSAASSSRGRRRESRGNGAPMQGELLVGYAPGLPPTALKPGQAPTP